MAVNTQAVVDNGVERPARAGDRITDSRGTEYVLGRGGNLIAVRAVTTVKPAGKRRRMARRAEALQYERERPERERLKRQALAALYDEGVPVEALAETVEAALASNVD